MSGIQPTDGTYVLVNLTILFSIYLSPIKRYFPPPSQKKNYLGIIVFIPLRVVTFVVVNVKNQPIKWRNCEGQKGAKV